MRKKFLLILVLMIVLSVNTLAFAATGSATGNVSLIPSSNSANTGDTFTIEIAQECSDGIIGFESQLSYDSDLLTLQNTAMGSEWTNLGEGNKLEAMSNNDIKSGNVFVLTFTVKGTGETTTKIGLSNIKLYKTPSESVDIAEKSITMLLNDKTTTNNNTTNTNIINTTNTIKTNININDKKNNNNNNNTTTSISANTTTNNMSNTATKSLPKAGTTKIILVIISGLVILAFVCYYEYRRYKEI